MIFSIKTTLIALAAGLIIGILSGGTLAWKLQALRIERMEVAEQKRISVAKDELQALTEKLLKQERENASIATNLDKMSRDAELRRSRDATTIRNLLAASRGVLPGATVCEAPVGTSTTAAVSTNAGTTEGRLSTEFQEYLAEVLRKADEAADYARVGHEYAKAVEAQRERMNNEYARD